MPGGRPSDYSQEITNQICARLASGEPLTRICESEEMPGLTTVYRWMAEHEDFRKEYARAREDQADTLADEILKIADEKDEDDQRQRLRVDARRWYAGQIRPKKYGEKMTQEVSGPDGGPIAMRTVVNFVEPSSGS